MLLGESPARLGRYCRRSRLLTGWSAAGQRAELNQRRMAALSSRERVNLTISVLAGAVLVVGIVMEMWLTAGAMVLLIIGQLATFYGGRRARRS